MSDQANKSHQLIQEVLYLVINQTSIAENKDAKVFEAIVLKMVE